ncbi:Neurogenic locus protein delta [Papilio xuthus]|uniref:Delta-like protein n=1 Tax=Papilio xuthus TaxID=66420 RepID=A0A194Q0E6_PAPXU|nr:Neurogenic locus protein delta [Papilio xuthus]
MSPNQCLVWKGTFSLIVEAWHDTNETSRSDDSLIARMTKQSIADVGGPWVDEEQRWGGPGGAHLRLSYRVTCAAHYYGSGCEVLCRPRNDSFGHYTCSPAGEIVCRPGWTGDYCSKHALWRGGCHRNLSPTCRGVPTLAAAKNPAVRQQRRLSPAIQSSLSRRPAPTTGLTTS